MKLDAESSVDYTEHASKVIAESNEHFSSDLMNLDDEDGKIKQDFRSPTIEGKLSQSHTGSGACYSPGRSDPLNHKNESVCRDALFPNASSAISPIAKEDPFYMDKTVTEVELLHLAVPTRNGASPVVKDICIDEGEQPFEKILVEYDKANKDISFNSNLPKVNGHSALVEEMTEDDSCPDLKLSSINEGLDSFGKILEGNVGDKEFSIPDTHALYLNGKTDTRAMYLNEKTDTHAMRLNEKTDKTVMNDMKSLLVNGCPIEQCCPDNSDSEGGKLDATDIAADKVPSEKITEQRTHLLQKFYSEFPQVDLCGHNYRTGENQDLRRNFHQGTEEETNLTIMGASSSEKAHESRQILETVSGNTDVFKEESTSSFSVASSGTTLNRIDNIKEASDDFKLHDEVSNSGLVTEDSSIVGNESRVMNNQQTMKAQNGVGTEEPIIVGESSARSSFTHINLGDSSLPGPSCLSVPVTTSGHIPYSGSISLRSDSSTTSAHSFAFPIMQSEWNSSPIKMAKANRRRTMKHRWRTLLICCKF